jgi:hypothetical protein
MTLRVKDTGHISIEKTAKELNNSGLGKLALIFAGTPMTSTKSHPLFADQQPGKLKTGTDTPRSTDSPWSQHHAMADWICIMRRMERVARICKPCWGDE